MLGFFVTVNSPVNPILVATMQCRNMRIEVQNQKATVLYELYDPNQPVDQSNISIIWPTKPTYEFQYGKLDDEIQKWLEDLRKHQLSSTTIKTQVRGKINYITGIPVGLPDNW